MNRDLPIFLALVVAALVAQFQPSPDQHEVAGVVMTVARDQREVTVQTKAGETWIARSEQVNRVEAGDEVVVRGVVSERTRTVAAKSITLARFHGRRP